MPPRFITEFELIRRLQQTIPILPRLASSIHTGIGDDAAIVKPRPRHVLLASTDLLAELVHFDFAYMTYRQVGYRAAVANLSDMAAMGATPRYVLVGIALPAITTPSDAQDPYSAVREA